MNCLSCGKPLKGAGSSTWHKACIRKFFGTADLPQIELNSKILEQLAIENTSKGLTVPGVQKKLSLHLSQGENPRLTVIDHPTGYIIKPQVDEFLALPEAEHLAMSLADAAGILTVPHALLWSEHAYIYITKRIDRIFNKNKMPDLLAMEDFCQLDLRLTQDKYKGSYERCAKVIARHSFRSGLDLTELFYRLVFSFLIGNSDLHLKNLSLIETAPRSNQYILSPAYDLLMVNVIMPEDQEQMALALNGKKTNLRKKDFLAFAAACDIPEMVADRLIQRLLSLIPSFIGLCKSSLLPVTMQQAFNDLLKRRGEVLS